MIPDREEMIAFAEHLEKVGDDQGWDAPPVLGTIVANELGYASGVLPKQPVDLARNGDVVGALLFMANRMLRSTGTGRAFLREIGGQQAVDKIAGLWFVSEGWMTTKPGNLREGARIVDLPRSQRQETRSCFLIDCAGRVFYTHRVRGSEPETYVCEPDDREKFAMQGNVPNALRRMLLAIGASMSTGMIDMEALGKVGVADE